MAGVKTTPVKKVSRSNSVSLCRVCGSQVYVNGGFYSLVAGKLKEANIVQRIAELFGVEDDSSEVKIGYQYRSAVPISSTAVVVSVVHK